MGMSSIVSCSNRWWRHWEDFREGNQMGLKGFIYFIKFKVEDDYFEYQFVKFQI